MVQSSVLCPEFQTTRLDTRSQRRLMIMELGRSSCRWVARLDCVSTTARGRKSTGRAASSTTVVGGRSGPDLTAGSPPPPLHQLQYDVSWWIRGATRSHGVRAVVDCMLRAGMSSRFMLLGLAESSELIRLFATHAWIDLARFHNKTGPNFWSDCKGRTVYTFVNPMYRSLALFFWSYVDHAWMKNTYVAAALTCVRLVSDFILPLDRACQNAVSRMSARDECQCDHQSPVDRPRGHARQDLCTKKKSNGVLRVPRARQQHWRTLTRVDGRTRHMHLMHACSKRHLTTSLAPADTWWHTPNLRLGMR